MFLFFFLPPGALIILCYPVVGLSLFFLAVLCSVFFFCSPSIVAFAQHVHIILVSCIVYIFAFVFRSVPVNTLR